MATATTTRPTTKTPPKPATGRCSLSLSINGQRYKVRPFQPEAFGVIKAFTLTGPEAGPYTVAESIEGPSCTCADFEFRRAGIDPGGCKHVRAARACGLL